MVNAEWDWASIEAHLEKARNRAGSARPRDGTLVAKDVEEEIVAGIGRDLEALRSLLTDPVAGSRSPCPFCRRIVNDKATLCGFCWARLTPGASGQARAAGTKA